jgi:hypothetical protein
MWAGMPGGARMPLDPAEREPAAGMVAYFQGRGRMVTPESLEPGDNGEGAPWSPSEVEKWATRGATFHVAHFSSCVKASAHRGVSRSQEALW